MQGPRASSSRPIVPVVFLRAFAALVAAAALLSFAAAFRKDYWIAFQDASPSEFPASVSGQVEAMTRVMPPGETLLLVAEFHADGGWYARLFQRALYPRNRVIVGYMPLAPADIASLRRQWSARYGLALGVPPPDLGFLNHEDLGSLPAMKDRVWFGQVGP